MGKGFSERGPTERRPEAQGEKSLEGEHRQGHRRPGSRTPKSDARRDSHPSVLLMPFQTRCPRPVPETPRVCPCLRACPGCSLSWSNPPPAPATPAPPRPAALRPHAGLLKTDPTFHSRHSLTLVPTHAHAHTHASRTGPQAPPAGPGPPQRKGCSSWPLGRCSLERLAPRLIDDDRLAGSGVVSHTQANSMH